MNDLWRTQAIKLLTDFKMSQPRKKRPNIDAAFRKFRENKPLNKREKETFEAFTTFCEAHAFEGVKR